MENTYLSSFTNMHCHCRAKFMREIHASVSNSIFVDFCCRNAFLSQIKRTRKRGETVKKKKTKREQTQRQRETKKSVVHDSALSSFPPVNFLPADNFIGTLDLSSGHAVASPIKARVDHSGTSVLTADQHEQHRQAESE